MRVATSRCTCDSRGAASPLPPTWVSWSLGGGRVGSSLTAGAVGVPAARDAAPQALCDLTPRLRLILRPVGLRSSTGGGGRVAAGVCASVAAGRGVLAFERLPRADRAVSSRSGHFKTSPDASKRVELPPETRFCQSAATVMT